MKRRRIMLGVDYGTSFSKIVLRDYGAPGGEKAQVLGFSDDFRIPSAVGIADSKLVFGSEPGRSVGGDDMVWHESIKMRVAEEIKGNRERYCYGPLRKLPSGFSASDLAVLTVWFLVSSAIHDAKTYIGSNPGDVIVNFCMGVPMSFFNEPELRGAFLSIARHAWEILQRNGALSGTTLPLEQARRLLDEAYESVSQKSDLADYEVRDWIRSEAEAALWWPFRSPSIGDGPYAQVDIGAGTTNLSIFRLVSKSVAGQWIRERISFFGAESIPAGMDAMDRALADWRGAEETNCLSLRGVEKSLLKKSGAVVAVSDVLARISEAYRSMLARAFATHLQASAERQAWRGHKVFFIGGGSELERITEWLQRSPLPDNEKHLHAIVRQEKPFDLSSGRGGKVSNALLSHIAVAYGLSNLSADLPRAETPGEVPPMEQKQAVRRQSGQLLDIDEWRY